MQSLLSSRPDAMTKASALLHLGVALENRGGEQDLLNARNSYSTVAGDSVKYPIMAAEALAGLSRISMADGDVETARNLLVRSIEMRGDTTEFDEYQLARMDWME